MDQCSTYTRVEGEVYRQTRNQMQVSISQKKAKEIIATFCFHTSHSNETPETVTT
jgi:hypothetical protein